MHNYRDNSASGYWVCRRSGPIPLAAASDSADAPSISSAGARSRVRPRYPAFVQRAREPNASRRQHSQAALRARLLRHLTMVIFVVPHCLWSGRHRRRGDSGVPGGRACGYHRNERSRGGGDTRGVFSRYKVVLRSRAIWSAGVAIGLQSTRGDVVHACGLVPVLGECGKSGVENRWITRPIEPANRTLAKLRFHLSPVP
jgi:hypothetical protein